jgi:hypothetical protein
MKRILSPEAEREQLLAMISTYEVIKGTLPEGTDLPSLASLTEEIVETINSDCEELRVAIDQQQPYLSATKAIAAVLVAFKKRKHGL